MNDSPVQLPAPLHTRRLFVLACYYGLMVFFLVQNLVTLDGPLRTALFLWVVQILPLLIFFWGLHKTHLRTYAWLSLAILLYFIHGVMVAFIPERMLWGLAEVVLCVGLFSGLLLFIRGYRQHFKVPL